MTKKGIDEKYYINVAELMVYDTPRCKLPRPKMKPRILINYGELLPIIDGDTGKVVRV